MIIPVSNAISDKLLKLMRSERATERQIHSFLKQYPYVLTRLVHHSWNFYRIFSELRLGTDSRCDFAVVSADSGGWHINVIELKSPRGNPYTKRGLPSRELNTACVQLARYHEFCRVFQDQVRREVAKSLKLLGVPAYNRLAGQNVTAELEICYPQTPVHFTYHLIIGDSCRFTQVQREAHGRVDVGDRVITYDRVVRAIRQIEADSTDANLLRKALAYTGHEGLPELQR